MCVFSPRFTLFLLFLLGAIAIFPNQEVNAQDWPQFLGPYRNGLYTGDEQVAIWKDSGPEKLWQKKIGEGFSGPVVSDGKLILFHRVEDQEVLECLDAQTGKEIWKVTSPTQYKDDFGFDEGPRSTPTIQDRSIYTFGSSGKLQAHDFKTGKLKWSVDTIKKFGAEKGYFGPACSPLVDQGRLLMNIGGKNNEGIIAFDTQSGKVLWSATNDEASYSSPVLAKIEGKPHAVFFTRTGLVDLDPVTGKIFHQMRFRARINASVNAAVPIVIENQIFLSTEYNVGAKLLKVEDGKYQEVWANNESLSAHYTTPIYHQGVLFGLHGRQEYFPSLRCVDWKTGEVKWSQIRYRAGHLIKVGEHLLVMRDDGQLDIIAVNTEKYDLLAKATLLTGTTRACPAFAKGIFYTRNEDTLAAFKLSK